MFNTAFSKRPLIENSQTVSVANFVRYNLVSLNQRVKDINEKPLDLAKEEDVRKFIEIAKAGITINLKQENSGKVDYSLQNRINLTYTKSNLGKGFVIWFVCNGCSRKVRKLYIPANSEVLLCRRCHGLGYRKQNETKDKLVARLVKNPSLLSYYLESNSPKMLMAAFEAQMITERAKEEAKQRFDKLDEKEP